MAERALRRWFAAWILLLLCAPSASAVEYTFTNILDSTQHNNQRSGFSGTPSINDLGEVAFASVVPTGVTSAVYKGSGGPLTTIVAGGYPGIDPSEVSINNAGQVAFFASFYNGDRGIFVGAGGAVTTIVHSSGPLTLPFDTKPWLDDSGRVVFVAFTDGGTPGIYLGDGASTPRVFDATNTPLSTFLSDMAPVLTEDGAISFAGRDPAGEIRIYRGIPGGSLTLIRDTAGQYCTIRLFLTANGAGQVAWAMTPPPPLPSCPPMQLWVGNGGALGVALEEAAGFSLRSFAINDSGTVALWALLAGGDYGIFTTDDLSDAVIRTGDPLFGSTLESAWMGRQGFNEAGQIAFRYELADGRVGFARADPPATTGDCANAVDDDGDGAADLDDPGCAYPLDPSEHDVALVCDDGVDNDSDGAADYPSDVGCQSQTSRPENPQCQDGIDNDAAIGTDFDGGVSALGPGNGDPNGPDPNCTAPWLNRERIPPGFGCGLGPELLVLLAALRTLQQARARRPPSPP